jgi:hypothetical protein
MFLPVTTPTYGRIWAIIMLKQQPAINLGLQVSVDTGFVGMIYLYFWKTSQRVEIRKLMSRS